MIPGSAGAASEHAALDETTERRDRATKPRAGKRGREGGVRRRWGLALAAPQHSCRAVATAAFAMSDILTFRTLGGLHNSKECLLNAIIAAHELRLSLALPPLRLVGEGNERFAPPHAQYAPPFDRPAASRFGVLYNSTHAALALSRLAPLARPPRPPPAAVRLRACGGDDGCFARAGSGARFGQLLAAWRRQIDGEARAAPPPRVFDAAQLLCYGAYESRDLRACAAQFGACAAAAAALRWSGAVLRLQARAAEGVRRRAAGARWAAVHARAFACAERRRAPSFAHVREALRRLGHPAGGVLYLVSALPVQAVANELPEYVVVSKDTFMGDTARKYPFEVRAAVDFAVAVEAPIYLGVGLASSFDAFVAAERSAANASPLHHLAEGEPCGSGNRTRAREMNPHGHPSVRPP
ncbi:hypothetical protein AB1Y20_022069 [Prymnesium parvum]|uniref:Uncharacterized protein n=1 Tax=Prymnesium parvum TaxID=97485 RepID=A0AB34JG16_PRYPA